jgi:hypothetical protein
MIEIKNLGPRFLRLKPNEIKITEGNLANSVFQTICKIEPTKTTLTLKLEDKIIGTAHAEYEPAKHLTTLFDAYIQNEFQRQGLASLMVHLLFREQLLYTDTKNFDIRMVMKASSEKEVIENVGMGLIALKLGFVPAQDYSEILTNNNISNLEIIPAEGNYPFGYKISLRSSPWTIILVLLDLVTQKPVKDLSAYEHFIRAEELVELVRTNQAVLGNLDYILNPNSLEQFVGYIAENEEEFDQFLRKLKR